MQVLPSGLVLPPLPYAAALLVATAALVAALSRLGPAVTGRHVLAFVPWMAAGGALLLALVAGAVAIAVGAGAGGFLWPPVGVLGAAAATGVAYVALRSWQPAVLAHHGTVIALFAHALDGVSTAIGVDVLGTDERTPIPRMIMEFAGALPTAPYLGRGWLFVLAKMAVAGGIVVLLADYVEDDPTEGNLLFAFVAAVGLGPAANNLTLFLLSGGV